MRKEVEEWVWFYHKQGFSIIPIEKNGKRPNIPTWEQYQFARPDKDEIQHWLDAKLFDNIGIICGAVSGNLVVLDIDDETIVSDLGLNLNRIGEKSWIVKTGRGYHIYAKANKNPGGTVKKSDLKIEHRANGGYVVAPPSIHKNTSMYKFMNADTPTKLSKLQEQNTEILWSQLVTRVAKLKGIDIKRSEMPTAMENIDADCIANILKGVSKGKRNDTAFALTHYYKYIKQMSPTETESLILSWNDRNHPSLPKREVLNIIKSAIKNGGKTGCRKLQELGFCPYKAKKDCRFINPNAIFRRYENPPKTLEEVYERVQKWLYIENTERIDLILATALSTFSSDKPLWIFLVGASGDAKSELVKTLDGLPYVEKLDMLTSNSLASAYTKNGEEVKDIGYRLQNKHSLIIFTDLAFLTTLNSDEKRKIWGQFRNLYDGEITKDAGTGIRKEYKDCHVSMLACTTSAAKDDYHINQQLGTRELMYGTEANPDDDVKKMIAAVNHKNKEKQMKEELREAMQGFLEAKEFDETIEIPEYVFNKIIKKCLKLKIMRASAGSTDWKSGEIETDAEGEVPSRLIQQFSLLYRSIYSLDDKYPEDKFLNLIENIVRSSSHPARYKIFNVMADKNEQWFSIKDLIERTRLGRRTINQQCFIMWNMNILDREIREERVGGYLHVDFDGRESMRGGRVEEVPYYRMRQKIYKQTVIDT